MADQEAILAKLDELHEKISDIKTQTRQMRQINRLIHPEAYDEALATVADETGRVRVACPRCDEVNLVGPEAGEMVRCWQCQKTFSRERASSKGVMRDGAGP